ncbi:flavin-containing monooxygenase [uncultured Amnibacterium sp.]|uniref:flavin-containing monooxygenase n=1 Tax=uncultured Amnibacterium sp. TaxID=1631851 RepID=UPI0035CBF63C
MTMQLDGSGGATTRTGLRVAVVGAGVSGVVTARVLTAVGFAVTVFEKADDIGGVWSATRAYPGVATQDDRRSYSFSGMAMPSHVAQHPLGAEVQTYLAEYLAAGVPQSQVRLSTQVLRADLIDGDTWQVDSVGPRGRVTEMFDWLVAANGVFSTPYVPDWPGREEFEAAGGRVITPGSLADGAVLDDRRTVVVGWGKTACDVAVHAATRGTATAVVARTLTWKYPKQLGLAGLTFRHLVLTRAGERLIGTRYRSVTGRLLLRRIPERIPRVLLGKAIARAVDRTTGLSELGLLPNTEVRTSNSLVTDGFFEAVADGRIRVHRERSVATLGNGPDGPYVELSDGQRLAADVVVAATGYEQGADFLSPEVLQRGATSDGSLLLHNRVLAVDVPRLAFIGWAHSFRSPLTSEIAAVWLAGVLLGQVALPTPERQRARADRFPVARVRMSSRINNALPPVTLKDLDRVLDELGLPLPWSIRVRQIWRPIDPADYAAALEAFLQRHSGLTPEQITAHPTAQRSMMSRNTGS